MATKLPAPLDIPGLTPDLGAPALKPPPGGDDDPLATRVDTGDAATEEVPLSMLLSEFMLEAQKARRDNTEAAQSPIPAMDESSMEATTSPGMVPAAAAAAEALTEKRGEIEQLLQAVGPFLWSLEEAAKWVQAHGVGDAAAASHVRSLTLLSKILGQLQARIDEAAKKVAK